MTDELMDGEIDRQSENLLSPPDWLMVIVQQMSENIVKERNIQTDILTDRQTDRVQTCSPHHGGLITEKTFDINKDI